MEFSVSYESETGSPMCDILLSSSGEFDENSFLYGAQLENNCNGNADANANGMTMMMLRNPHGHQFCSEHEYHSWLLANSQSQCPSPDSVTTRLSFSSSSDEDCMSANKKMIFHPHSLSLNPPQQYISHDTIMDASNEEKSPIPKSNKRKSASQDMDAAQNRIKKLCTNEDNEDSLTRGKTRARRGSATDPQSVYARKRRERINERLKVLQNLVPNGTKVDISTMLEQAIQYVKFMQLQIKLLSSDEHWMYTPIAFNGCIADIPGMSQESPNTTDAARSPK